MTSLWILSSAGHRYPSLLHLLARRSLKEETRRGNNKREIKEKREGRRKGNEEMA